MAKIEELKRGTQIIYVPMHAKGDLDHPDCEEGFVTSARQVGPFGRAWCRFWSKHDPSRLRTRSCSEGCNPDDLVIKDTRPQSAVDHWLGNISG